MNYSKNVERGATWLDDKYPGWFRKIDRTTLNMEKYSTCILGQTLDGDKHKCFKIVYLEDRTIGESDKWAFNHGFVTEQPAKIATYLYLRQAWLDLIDARLKKEGGNDGCILTGFD